MFSAKQGDNACAYETSKNLNMHQLCSCLAIVTDFLILIILITMENRKVAKEAIQVQVHLVHAISGLPHFIIISCFMVEESMGMLVLSHTQLTISNYQHHS